ncbi:protein of unknown function [Blastococcus saxobsidens DD2]|uniref:Uncharacterized protein n=1 Tax=Blastococcus saxobsidens (strain DD2) TaxID=1146883 RepID=H6RTW1_BLASD|nr:protein of unknown function [Blastococcus saxobsidens DD2]
MRTAVNGCARGQAVLCRPRIDSIGTEWRARAARGPPPRMRSRARSGETCRLPRPDAGAPASDFGGARGASDGGARAIAELTPPRIQSANAARPLYRQVREAWQRWRTVGTARGRVDRKLATVGGTGWGAVLVRRPGPPPP